MTKLELRLDRLECHVQGDASGGSEPNLWPMLIWVSDATLATPALVRSNHPHTPRTVLGQDVRAGAVLAVPPGAGTTGVRLAEGAVLRSALAVVSLLANETPELTSWVKFKVGIGSLTPARTCAPRRCGGDPGQGAA